VLRTTAALHLSDREVSVGPKCPEISLLSSRQVILGLSGSLQDTVGLLPDLLGRFLRKSTDGLLHTAGDVLDGEQVLLHPQHMVGSLFT
jgi:hypothetical protein